MARYKAKRDKKRGSEKVFKRDNNDNHNNYNNSSNSNNNWF